MHRRKAMAVSQVFIYITSIIVIALVLLFGYKAIVFFMGQMQTSDRLQFERDIKSAVEELRSDYGTVKEREFVVPAPYREICFVDIDLVYNIPPPIPNLVFNVHPIIADSVNSHVEKNMFLDESTSFYVGKISVEDSPPYKCSLNPNPTSPIPQQYLCLCVNPTQGRIKLLFEGAGKTTKISLVT